MAIKTISHAISDVGRVRASNQDSGYAGVNLFFVADGMGGHAGGDIASALVAQRVAQIDEQFTDVEAAKKAMVDTIWNANGVLASAVEEHSELAGMGTTFSGLTVVGDQMVIAHIGDSRVYLVRDGHVTQITSDHTFVQRLVDTGRITPEEALVHPRRSVLMRVLGDQEARPEIDTLVVGTQPGDRWMLCSDGLCGYVPDDITNRILTSRVEASEAAELLVGETLEHGAPDNVTVIVLDVVSAATQTDFVATPRFVGSGANEVVIEERKGRKILRIFNTKILDDIIGRGFQDAEFLPGTEEYLEQILLETRSRIRWRRIRQLATIVVLLGLGIALLGAAYSYTQTRYYVTEKDGYIAIYQGIREELGPFKFNHLIEKTDYRVADLTDYWSSLVSAGSVTADSLANAEATVKLIIEQSTTSQVTP
ncbi:MAG: serine/threonine-protein phosphatase [Actinomycetales bacterium]|nr:serine/threonine-protein phosphatase [Actinomycetales bacterium]